MILHLLEDLGSLNVLALSSRALDAFVLVFKVAYPFSHDRAGSMLQPIDAVVEHHLQ